MMRLRKAVSINLLALALLVACGDNEPSNSDIKKQLSSQISPCPELSITNFQKINGYPQNDGSYIDQVQYSIIFTPSDQMRNYVAEFEQKKEAITNDGATDNARLQAAADRVQGMACYTTYQTALKNINNELFGTESNGIKVPGALDYLVTSGWLDHMYSNDNWMPDDDRNMDYAPGNKEYLDDLTTLVTKLLQSNQNENYNSEYMKELNALNNVKSELANSVSNYSSCSDNVRQIISDNKSAVDHIHELDGKMLSAKNEYLTDLENSLNNDCPIIVIGGVLGMFNANKDNIEAYGQTYKLTESGTVHLIKSDNGWVIQN